MTSESCFITLLPTIPVVHVTTIVLTQCDDCGKWVRVGPPDPNGSKSVPLRLDPFDSGPREIR
jgi:hypothetical protein